MYVCSFVATRAKNAFIRERRSKREYIFVGPPRCRKVHAEAVATRYKYRFCIETTSPIQYYAIQDDSERYFDSGPRLKMHLILIVLPLIATIAGVDLEKFQEISGNFNRCAFSIIS